MAHKRKFAKETKYVNRDPYDHPMTTPPRAMRDEHLIKAIAVNDRTVFEWAHQLADLATKIGLHADKLHPDEELEKKFAIARSTFQAAATNRRKLLDEVNRRLATTEHYEHRKLRPKSEREKANQRYKPYHREQPDIDQR